MTQIIQDNFVKVTTVGKKPAELCLNTHYIVSMKAKGEHTLITVKGSLGDDIAPLEVVEPIGKLLWDIKVGLQKGARYGII